MEEKTSFNQTDYLKDWTKKNMRYVSVKYKKDFVEEFKSACKKLGVSQSDVVRQAMQETIAKAKEQES